MTILPELDEAVSAREEPQHAVVPNDMHGMNALSIGFQVTSVSLFARSSITSLGNQDGFTGQLVNE